MMAGLSWAGAQEQGKEQSAKLGKPTPVQSAPVLGQEVLCDGCGEAIDTCCCGRSVSVYVDWLYLQPRGSDLGYAYPTDEAFGLPLGPTEQIDFDYEPEGGRIGIVLQRPCTDRRIRFEMLHFEADTNDSAFPPEEMTLQTLLLVSPDPLTADAATSTFGIARGQVWLNWYDLDYVVPLLQTDCREISGWVGARIATLDQSLAVQYDRDWLRAGQDLRGAGIRAGLGIDGSRGRLLYFGKVSGSLLATSMDVDYVQVNELAGQVVDYSQDIDRVLPVVDIELGLGLKLGCHCSISAGYMYSLWFNVVTPPELIEALQADDYSGDVEDTLTFDGLFTRFEVTW
jgi:hypothetical protein